MNGAPECLGLGQENGRAKRHRIPPNEQKRLLGTRLTTMEPS